MSPRTGSAGFSLIEVMVAMLMTTVMMIGLMSLVAVASKHTENEGHLGARATEYAQDKMEQLMVLAWGDEVSNTTVFPTLSTGGTGLKIGGSANLETPVAGYVDWLDQDGHLLPANGTTAPASWFYKRVWKIESLSPHVKRVTAAATVRFTIGGAVPPVSTLASLKTEPF